MEPKICCKKLPTGCRLNKKQSKFEARCCTCWDPHETDDHLIQCPKRNNFRNRIYSEIENLRPTLDPVLHDILNDGVRQHVGKKKYTIYDEHGSGNKGDYKRLQEEQKAIGWDNLLRGKYSKYWRSIQKRYASKQKVKKQ